MPYTPESIDFDVMDSGVRKRIPCGGDTGITLIHSYQHLDFPGFPAVVF